jgi:hypothetical protein
MNLGQVEAFLRRNRADRLPSLNGLAIQLAELDPRATRFGMSAHNHPAPAMRGYALYLDRVADRLTMTCDYLSDDYLSTNT